MLCLDSLFNLYSRPSVLIPTVNTGSVCDGLTLKAGIQQLLKI
jgi:hypothetical protein